MFLGICISYLLRDTSGKFFSLFNERPDLSSEVKSPLPLWERSPEGRVRGISEASVTEISVAEFNMHNLFLISATLQYCNTDTPHPALCADLSHKGRGESYSLTEITSPFVKGTRAEGSKRNTALGVPAAAQTSWNARRSSSI